MAAFERLAEVWRGDVVESVHFGVAAVANADGEVIHGWGDPSFVTYPRSSLKPVQAVMLVESGAAKAYGLSARHVSLACASHTAENFHAETVHEWLGRLDLSEGGLACGPDYPRDEEAVFDLVRAGKPKSRILHNCSGKHCGYLTVARHQGWDVEGYNARSHPTQALYSDVLSELLGHDAESLPFGVDGCSLPAPALPVGDMARVMARFAAAKVSAPQRKDAIREIQAAVRLYPEYMSGTTHPTARIAYATDGQVIMKTGAEGYLIAFLPDQELGIALKVADGDSRARVIALIALLRQLDLLPRDAAADLASISEVPVRNSVNGVVGRIRPCTGPHLTLVDGTVSG